jgi:hypothetical protein
LTYTVRLCAYDPMEEMIVVGLHVRRGTYDLCNALLLVCASRQLLSQLAHVSCLIFYQREDVFLYYFLYYVYL